MLVTSTIPALGVVMCAAGPAAGYLLSGHAILVSNQNIVSQYLSQPHPPLLFSHR